MDARKFRHIRAAIYLTLAGFCLLLLIYGIIFEDIVCSFWGFIGGWLWWSLAGVTASDVLNDCDYHSEHYDD